MQTNPTLTEPGTRREEAVLQQIIEQVEPLTRFDRSLFKDVSTAAEIAAVTAWQRFTVRFQIDEDTGPGGVPHGTTLLSDAAALRSRMDRELAEVRLNLPQRLQQWLDAQTTVRPEVRLSATDCFEEPDPVGHHYHCSTCGGTGSVICWNCRGNKQVICGGCEGGGTMTCGACSGGYQSCGRCNGQGSWTEMRSRTTSSGTHGDQEFVTVDYPETVYCSACSNGSIRCGTCGGSAAVTCATCGGTKAVGCGTCGASGELICTPCQATGWLYERLRLRALINAEFYAQADAERDEVRQLLSGRDDLADLATLARGVSCIDEEASAYTIKRTFVAMVDVTTLTLRVADVFLEIIGYGDPPHIFDFKNIVGRLLEADLKALETVLRSSPKYVPGLRPWLDSALSAFLASEANARIAGSVRASLSPDQIEQVMATDFRQIVSADYVARAVSAIRESIECTYWGVNLLGALAVLVLPTLLLVLGDYYRLILFGPKPALCLGIVGLGVALILAWHGKRGVYKRFGKSLGPSLQGVLEDSGILRRGRRVLIWAAVSGALIGWIGGAIISATIFTLQHPAHPKKPIHPVHKSGVKKR